MNISRFEIYPNPIDESSFGIFFKAYDTVEKRYVCLKLIKSNIFAEYKEYILNEVEILKKLKHPNIVEYFGDFFENEKFYIVLEFVERGDLRSFLQKNKPPLQEKTIISFFSQMISAIQYMHNLKIIHRDLKPGNVLLTKDDKIKLSDFNCAKIISSDCLREELAGTPGYIAPEVFKLEKYSFPVDVWSLGCVIYELMTGKTPFFHQEMSILKKMILNQNPDPIKGNYSPVLKESVMKMLIKNPEERITVKEIQRLLSFI